MASRLLPPLEMRSSCSTTVSPGAKRLSID